MRALGEPAGVLQLLDRHNRDGAAWAARLGVPLRRAWEGVGDTPFEALPVRRQPLVARGRALGAGERGRSSAPTRSARSRSSAPATSRSALHPLLRLVPAALARARRAGARARRSRRGCSRGRGRRPCARRSRRGAGGCRAPRSACSVQREPEGRPVGEEQRADQAAGAARSPRSASRTSAAGRRPTKK